MHPSLWLLAHCGGVLPDHHHSILCLLCPPFYTDDLLQQQQGLGGLTLEVGAYR